MRRLAGDAIFEKLSQSLIKIAGITESGKMTEKLFPVAFCQTLDQLLLGCKIDIEGPRADSGFSANVMHCGAMKALLGKAQLCRIQNAIAAGVLLFRREAGQGNIIKNERSFILCKNGFLSIRIITQPKRFFCSGPVRIPEQGATRSHLGWKDGWMSG